MNWTLNYCPEPVVCKFDTFMAMLIFSAVIFFVFFLGYYYGQKVAKDVRDEDERE